MAALQQPFEIPYLAWLAALEHDQNVQPGPTPLQISFRPDDTSFSALVSLINRIALRFFPTPALESIRADIIATGAFPEAAPIFAAQTTAIAPLLERITREAEGGKLIFMQTLPHVGDQTIDLAVDQANLALIRHARQHEHIHVVPIHRVATLDVMLAAESFYAVREALEALGRTSRANYIWNRVLDLAWQHWHSIAAASLPTPKAVVTDLDGVVWDGILREDGLDAVRTGGSALVKVAHSVWRDVLCRRSQGGVLLAALSRNEKQAAIDALDGVQAPASFAGVWADSNIDKAAEFGAILQFFDGIAPQSVVFVDDNATEQERMRLAWPSANVPAVAAPPLLIGDLLAQIPAARSGTTTDSDRQRTAFYAAKSSGELVPEIVCIVDPSDRALLLRMAQLHARTNQFNMTTPRRTAEDLQRLLEDPSWAVLALEVHYHGAVLTPELMGVAELHQEQGGDCVLDSFLASCRLLWAGSQQRMFDLIRMEAAKRFGAKTLIARWRPNERNEAFERWFEAIGWSQDVTARDGGLDFRGTTATRDGEAPRDLLAILSTYLEKKRHSNNAIVAARVRPNDGATELLVPGAVFRPGLTSDDADIVRAVFGIEPIGERDCSAMTLPPLWVSKYLVTRAEFAVFLSSLPAAEADEGAAAANGGFGRETDGAIRAVRDMLHPVTATHAWATRYAAWVAGRLPTEAEWERVARGEDERWFPWGHNAPLPPYCPPRGDELPAVTDMNADSPFGVVGLTGCVWQWCCGAYRDHPPYRGGDINSNAYFLRSTVRPREAAEHCGHIVGIRVVRDTE